jgi:hypothetical protein
MIEKRGRLDDEDVDRFTAAASAKYHAVEVVAIVAASTITNCTGGRPLWERRFRNILGRLRSG